MIFRPFAFGNYNNNIGLCMESMIQILNEVRYFRYYFWFESEIEGITMMIKEQVRVLYLWYGKIHGYGFEVWILSNYYCQYFYLGNIYLDYGGPVGLLILVSPFSLWEISQAIFSYLLLNITCSVIYFYYFIHYSRFLFFPDHISLSCILL